MTESRARKLPALRSVHTVAFDFDGVFTDNKVLIDQDGRESVRCDRADGLAFDFVRAFQRRGLSSAEFFIVSKESNPVVQARAKKLKLVCHGGVGDKLSFLTHYIRAKFPEDRDAFAGLIYAGNDLNDVPVMRRAGFSVAPSDCHPHVRDVADLVMEQRGGDGFVRAFIELLLGINHLSGNELDELVSNS